MVAFYGDLQRAFAAGNADALAGPLGAIVGAATGAVVGFLIGVYVVPHNGDPKPAPGPAKR